MSLATIESPGIERNEVETGIDQVAPVQITQAAVKQILFLMSKKGGANLSLRIGVKGGGCSGLSYVMNIEESPTPKDSVFEIEGLSVFIDAKSLQFIDGLELDYTTKNLLEGGWKFTNPNATRLTRLIRLFAASVDAFVKCA